MKIKTGIIGCGNISGIYLQNLSKVFTDIDLVACADLNVELAKSKAEMKDDNGNPCYPGLQGMSVEDLLADKEIRIVVNLTTPQAHFDVAMKIVESGKSVYNEKPLTLTREEGKKLLAAADAKGVLVGCAPDTFMGAGIQTCRKLLEDGWIGKPTSATAFMCCVGHESWHPNPGFYYLNGGGPLFDMGPYYLTAMVNLLGSIDSVAGMSNRAKKQRLCTCAERAGERLPVEVETHVCSLLKFSCGAVGTMITTFDVAGHHLPNIEIHGTLGSLRVPDPNCFGGEVEYCKLGGQWQPVPLTHGYADNSRGMGVADIARVLLGDKTPHRANGELAYHVLDAMHSILESSDQEKFIKLESTTVTPEPLGIQTVCGKLI